MKSCFLRESKVFVFLVTAIIASSFVMSAFAEDAAEELEFCITEHIELSAIPDFSYEIELEGPTICNVDWLNAQVETMPDREETLKHFLYTLFLLSTLQRGEGDITAEEYHSYIEWLKLPCELIEGEAEGEEILCFSDDFWIEFTYDMVKSRYIGARVCVNITEPSLDIAGPFETSYEVKVEF